MEIINRTAVKLLENFPSVYSHALLHKKSPLREWGWFRSFREQRSVDADGEPLPWFTYGAIEFLKRRIPRRASVFEYGAGNGTLWWAARVKQVDAVEHHSAWYESVRARMPGNVTLRHVPLGGSAYPGSILATRQKYDIVVVDGRERNACVKPSLRALAPTGVIIWDDSNRERYAEGIASLREQGFRMIEFRGFSPIEFMMCETGILYRPDNCLGI